MLGGEENRRGSFHLLKKGREDIILHTRTDLHPRRIGFWDEIQINIRMKGAQEREMLFPCRTCSLEVILTRISMTLAAMRMKRSVGFWIGKLLAGGHTVSVL